MATSEPIPDLDPDSIEACRRMTVAEKWIRMGQRMTEARRLHDARMRRMYPGITAAEIHEDWCYLTLGTELVAELRQAGHLPVVETRRWPWQQSC
jgi:hypothetical protein